MYKLLVIVIFLYIIFSISHSQLKVEKFVNAKDPKFTLDYNDNGYNLKYTGNKRLNDEDVSKLVVSGLDPNKQKYLQFLGNINDKFKEYMPKTGTFRGSCDDKVNQSIQKRVLAEVFEKQDSDKGKGSYKREKSKIDPSKSYDCVGISSNLCESPNPYFYLSESTHFPPPWTIATYKNVDYPKVTNLKCFNKNLDCCRSSLN